MKRTFAAALAAASVGSTMLIATPAFASDPLTVQPDVVHNGDSVAITAICNNKANYPRLIWFGYTRNGVPGQPLKVEQEIGWKFMPGTYVIARECIKPKGTIATTEYQMLTVLFKAAPKPPPPPKPIPGFKPNVIIKTGLGGMARLVGKHHPVR